MSISKDGIALCSLTDWERHAGPKSSNQWVDGRSAKEAARAWLEGAGTILPAEVASALASCAAFGPVQAWRAEAEVKLRFDDFPGEPRNSDLVVHAEDARGTYLIAVEAKADEPFGETIAEALAAALDRYLENSRSNGMVRIQQLAAAILGARQPSDPPLKNVRYQLLTACAGALCEVERHGYTRVLLLVHEFVTDKTSDVKLARNVADLNAFVTRLSHGSVAVVQSGGIYGPFVVPGAPLVSANVTLFVGKVSRILRTGPA